MDKSAKYIKMCQEAKEIQKLWRPELGDFVWGIPDSEGELTVSICLSVDYYHSAYEQFELVDVAIADLWDEHKEIDFEWWDKEKLVWLPRQDQLQKIFYKHLQLDYPVIVDMYDFIKENLEYVKQFTSLEQLWLAYVMHEEYGKVWDEDKEEWVEYKD